MTGWTLRSPLRAAITSVLMLMVLAGCSPTPAAGGATPPPNQAPSQQSTPTPTSNPLILPPASTPSSVGICQQQLSFGADGDASPILCQNGAVNVLAWRYYQPVYPAIFALGAYATPNQIQQVSSQMSVPLTEADDAYCLAKAYFGWTYPENLNPYAAQQAGTILASTGACATWNTPFP